MLSVIMSTYREPEGYIRAAVESILSQTIADFEFIIVLDDPQNAAMQRLLAEYEQRDSRIVLLKNEQNLGLVSSLNRALQIAQGEFIARMDADDIAEPCRLERELAYLKRENLDIVGSLIKRIDEQGNPLPGTDSRAYPPAVVMDSLKVSPCVAHPTWLVKASVYAALHGYRPMERCEDYDFLLRALKHHYRIGVCPEPLLNYRIVSTGISRTALLKQHTASRYLSRQFYRIEEVTMEEIRREKLDKLTDAECEKYRRAEGLFFKALSHRRNPVKLLALLFCSLFTSKHQLTRFQEMLELRKIRKDVSQ